MALTAGEKAAAIGIMEANLSLPVVIKDADVVKYEVEPNVFIGLNTQCSPDGTCKAGRFVEVQDGGSAWWRYTEMDSDPDYPQGWAAV